MPLITISGFPCSGKTYRSKQLEDYFRSKIAQSDDPRISKISVHHLNEESLGLSRDVYNTPRLEKDARATEMSAVKRYLSRDSVVIADGLNYIKGYRYQLHCEAKAVQTPSCVIHVGTPADKCRELHAARLKENSPLAYPEADFENLIYRYEEPNGMTRWDSPLFTVLFEDETPPFDKIWEAMIGSSGQVKVVRPNAATVLKPATEQNYLYELDKATSDILAEISAWQKDHAGESGGEVKVSGVDDAIQLPTHPLSLPQLQRMRRQFIALNRQHTLEKARIRQLFVDYLNDAFGR
ncbi:uncharacterized protein PV09_06937 [Verruconis gallopava]|uniref:Chromatin associated protein KTI12 n=1 Tax=Verruconis gallopava TaxID=253628 RepID=A0A0D2ARD8_9PEZI|nr:uncharacterized protein PV09_06937 [Verruconis gallopava]KIW01764.1 hypothetical protein PV09_06937 [Verruconis gallopava]